MDSMVVCPEPLAAEVGKSVYEAGGNAADAAVATAFAQGVTNPLLCGIGGGGIMQVYDHETQSRVVLNCEVAIGSRPAPAAWADQFQGRAETVGRFIISSEENQIGHRSIMLPGFVRGCWELYQRFGSGKLSWQELLSPAIQLAANGFEVYPYIASFMNTNTGGDLLDSRPGYPNLNQKLKASKDISRIYLNDDGSFLAEGDRLIQAEYAKTLQRIADTGADDFYEGEIAHQIVQDFIENDALLTAQDFQDYTVDIHKPLRSHYRDVELSTTPLASTGPQLIEMLKILEHFDLSGYKFNSPEYVHLLARIQRASFADSVSLRCTEFSYGMKLVDDMISQSRASYWATRIEEGDPVVVEGGSVKPGTTHLTAIDEGRNVVTFTHSTGSIAGSGVITPGLGFLFNNFLGQYNPLPGFPDSIEPGKKFGGGVPSILFRDGAPILSLGAPGGSRIVTAVWQTIVNVLDQQMDVARAVSAPRFHSEEENVLFLERAFSEEVASELSDHGHHVLRSAYMSRVQAIGVTEAGLVAGADPRGGAGVGYHRA